jgi:hypothetical protein
MLWVSDEYLISDLKSTIQQIIIVSSNSIVNYIISNCNNNYKDKGKTSPFTLVSKKLDIKPFDYDSIFINFENAISFFQTTLMISDLTKLRVLSSVLIILNIQDLVYNNNYYKNNNNNNNNNDILQEEIDFISNVLNSLLYPHDSNDMLLNLV